MKTLWIRSIAAAVVLTLGIVSTQAGKPAQKDIVDTAVAAGSFNTLATALEAAGLIDTLKGAGPFTVFAPTDAAFAKLPAGTVEDLLKPENKAKLTSILTFHVVAGSVPSTEVVKMLGQDGPGRIGEDLHRGRRGDGQRCPGRQGRRGGVQRRHPRDRQRAPA